MVYADSMAKQPKKKPASGNPWPERLKKLRDKYGLSQPEAAARLEVPVASWRNWEYGRTVPNAATVKAIKLVFPD